MPARLSNLDASFLRVETPAAHMHVGWLSMLDLPAGARRLDVDALVEGIGARLHLVPRFRQRVAPAPLNVTEPGWRDDPGFDVRRHVTVAAARPLSPADLRRATDDFLSEQLPRDRPLWSLMVVPAVSRGRAAIVGKVHHAMVDGIAAVELGALLFDGSPEAVPAERVEWRPAPDEGPIRVLLDSLSETALDQFRAARRVAALGLSPGEGVRIANTMRRAALSLAEDAIRPAPRSPLNVPIGPRRTLVQHRVAMSRVMRLKQRAGVTLNDVVLAVVAGALRRLALELGTDPSDLRAMVPVSVRRPDDERGQGNRITFAFVDLPVTNRDPRRRIERVRRQTVELKASGRVAGTEILLRSVGSLPEPLKRRAAQLAASPRLYNLAVSNVPGPQAALYVAGARVRSIYPVIPIPEGHSVSIGVLSYEGALHFAAYADPIALPEVSRLPLMIEDSLEELAIGFAVSSPRPAGMRARSRARTPTPHGARRDGRPAGASRAGQARRPPPP